MKRSSFVASLVLAGAGPALAQSPPPSVTEASPELARRFEARDPPPCSPQAVIEAFRHQVAPALTGCSYESLREALSGFAPTVDRSPSDNAAADVITDQQPGAGQPVTARGVLTLAVSTGPAPSPTPMPTPTPTPSPTPSPDPVFSPLPAPTQSPDDLVIVVPSWVFPAGAGAIAVVVLLILWRLLSAISGGDATDSIEPPVPASTPPPIVPRFACELEHGETSLEPAEVPLVAEPHLGVSIEFTGEAEVGPMRIEGERVA
ncbi:MAG: hypothetical protein WDN44_12000 [Sphingomonas sp.]